MSDFSSCVIVPHPGPPALISPFPMNYSSLSLGVILHSSIMISPCSLPTFPRCFPSPASKGKVPYWLYYGAAIDAQLGPEKGERLYGDTKPRTQNMDRHQRQIIIKLIKRGKNVLSSQVAARSQSGSCFGDWLAP